MHIWQVLPWLLTAFPEVTAGVLEFNVVSFCCWPEACWSCDWAWPWVRARESLGTLRVCPGQKLQREVIPGSHLNATQLTVWLQGSMVPLCSDEPSHPTTVDRTQTQSAYGTRAKHSFNSRSYSSFTHKTPPMEQNCCFPKTSGAKQWPLNLSTARCKIPVWLYYKTDYGTKSSPHQDWEKEGKWKWEPPALTSTAGGRQHPRMAAPPHHNVGSAPQHTPAGHQHTAWSCTTLSPELVESRNPAWQLDRPSFPVSQGTLSDKWMLQTVQTKFGAIATDQLPSFGWSRTWSDVWCHTAHV